MVVTFRFLPPPPGTVSVDEIDMCEEINRAEHRTSLYRTPSLVVRRGQSFTMKVTFSQRVSPDDITVEFFIGPFEFQPRLTQHKSTMSGQTSA